MALTSQDLKSRIDITALTVVTGSELDQLVSTAYPADDKGLRIITTDSAVDIPVVPNPDDPLEGIIPIQWKRYKWVRLPFIPGSEIKEYNWDDRIDGDATFLKWVIFADVGDLQAQIDAAVTTANNAEVVANAANVNATNANNIANSAQTDADTANTAIGVINSSLTSINGSILNLDTAVAFMLPIVNNFVTPTQGRTYLEISGTPIGICRLVDTKVSTTQGGTFTNGAWRIRDLNNKEGDVVGNINVTLAANLITLKLGYRYIIRVWAPAYKVDKHQCRIYRNTVPLDVAIGSNAYASAANSGMSSSFAQHITDKLLVDTEYKIEHQCQTTEASDGFGAACGFTVEIYTQVEITVLSS